jgi:hypothetical protein
LPFFLKFIGPFLLVVAAAAVDYLHSLCINSAALQPDFRKTPFQNQPHIKQVMLIITRMKMDYPEWSILILTPDTLRQNWTATVILLGYVNDQI